MTPRSLEELRGIPGLEGMIATFEGGTILIHVCTEASFFRAREAAAELFGIEVLAYPEGLPKKLRGRVLR